MADERRNLYRILHVQPEAPQAVIKASYRALMSTLRGHPDLGGDHDHAARLNAAYAVLGDPQRRSVYDRAMRRPARGTAPAGAAEMAADPWCWLADKRCPYCHHVFAARPKADARCGHCGSPLAVAPATERAAGEILGRRRGERYARELDARLHLPGLQGHRVARLRDLSLTGLSLVSAQRIPKGSTFRVVTPTFDAVAAVVASRPSGAAWTTHAQLLTLQMVRSARGAFVTATA